MRQREQRSEQATDKPRRANPSQASATVAGPLSPAAVLALQRAAGNATVAAILGGRRASSDERSAAVPVQRVTGTGGRGAAGLLANRGAAEREQELSTKYGIRIGPAPGQEGEHFSHSLLDKIDSVLKDLPAEDLGPNQQLVAIEMDTSSGSASAYRSEDQTIGIVLPVLAGGVRAPAWLYAKLNKGVKWQRKRMDKGAMAGYEGVSAEGDRALGIGKGERHVMAGTSDALAHGNLVEWTLRHEVGHSVDMMTAWERQLAGEDHFGGWQAYEGVELDNVARAILDRAELTGVLPAADQGRAVTTLASLLNPVSARQNSAGDQSRLHRFLTRFQQHLSPQEFAERSATAIRFVRLALAQPWTLDNGGADVLDVNGRTYHVDHYETWVSYSTAQRRQYALSNYQFSTPKEWFAEAYAAYYDPKPGVRGRLHPQVQQWFATLPRPVPANDQAETEEIS